LTVVHGPPADRKSGYGGVPEKIHPFPDLRSKMPWGHWGVGHKAGLKGGDVADEGGRAGCGGRNSKHPALGQFRHVKLLARSGAQVNKEGDCPTQETRWNLSNRSSEEQ
jgi:hypothetical protein